jgi:hypothetical protein
MPEFSSENQITPHLLIRLVRGTAGIFQLFNAENAFNGRQIPRNPLWNDQKNKKYLLTKTLPDIITCQNSK